MKARVVFAALLTLAAVFGAWVLTRESRFAPGVPFTGVFAHYQSVEQCGTARADRLLIITPTDFYATYGSTWRRGTAVESRPTWLTSKRPSILMRAYMREGGRVELLLEPKREDAFEVVIEARIDAAGHRTNHQVRAPAPIFIRCAEEPADQPWLTAD